MDSAESKAEHLSKDLHEEALGSPTSPSSEIGNDPEQTPEPPQNHRRKRRCRTVPAQSTFSSAPPELPMQVANSLDMGLQEGESVASKLVALTDSLTLAKSGRSAPHSDRRASRAPKRSSENGTYSARNETQNLLEAGLRSLGQSTTVVAREGDLRTSTQTGEDEMDDQVAELSPREAYCPSLAETDATGGVYALGDQSFCLRLRRLLLQFGFSILLGSLVGLVTVIFHAVTEKFEEYHRLAASTLAEEMRGNAKDCTLGSCSRVCFSAWMAFGTFLASVLVGWISQSLVPECIGGGTIATKICLAVGSPVPARVGVSRFLLSMVYVGAGNALGIEAPTLHISASVASVLHNLAAFICSRLSRCDFANSRDGPPVAPFFTNEGLPQAVVLGCAAGLSAAFRSPLAAISYAVEEYVDVRQTGTVTSLVLLSSVSSTLVCVIFEPHFGMGAMSISSSVVSDSEEAQDTNQSEDQFSGIVAWLLTAMFLGLLLGSLSPMINAAMLHLRRFCHVERNVSHEVAFAGLSGLFTGLLGCGVYLLTGCESAWGFGRLGMVFNMRGVCAVGSEEGSGQEVWKILVLACSKILAFVACYATGGPGGVLMPSLFVGALLGRSLGHAVARFDGALPYAGTIFGMAALFSANMRLPLTAATVALEFATVDSKSYDVRLVCTVPLAAALGTWMSAWWDPLSVSERTMFQDGINPFTLSEQIQAMVQNQGEELVNCQDRRASIGSSFSQGSFLPIESSRSPPSGGSSLPGSGSPLLFTSASQRPVPKELISPVQRSSMRMIVAAQRRSILGAYANPTRSNSTRSNNSLCHASFFSSPDELLFASRVQKPKSAKFGAIFPSSDVQVEPLRKPAFPWAPCRRPSVEVTDTSQSSSLQQVPLATPKALHEAVVAQTSPQGIRPLDLGSFCSSQSHSSRRESKDSSRRAYGTPACSMQSGSFLVPAGLDCGSTNYHSSACSPSQSSRRSTTTSSPTNGILSNNSSFSMMCNTGNSSLRNTINSSLSNSPTNINNLLSSCTVVTAGAAAGDRSTPNLSSASGCADGFEGQPHPRLLGNRRVPKDLEKQAHLQILVPDPKPQSKLQRLRNMLWPKTSVSPGLELYTLSDEDDGDVAREER